MSVHRLSKDRWRVVVRFRGARRDYVVKGTKADAQDWEAAKRSEMSRGIETSSTRAVPALAAFRGAYEAHAKERLAPITFYHRRIELDALVAHFGALQLHRIGPAEIAEYQDRRLRHGLAASSVNTELIALRAVLSYARASGYPVPPWRARPLRVGRPAAPKAWTPAEVASVLDACTRECPTLYPIALLMADTGLRVGEALSLRPVDVDWERRVLRVQPHGRAWTPKDRDAREVPVSGKLAPWLAPEATRGKAFVFASPQTGGRRVWTDRLFRRAVKAAGLAGSAHSLRHSYATDLVQRTGDLFLVARILGHSDARTTDLYAALLPAHFDRARGGVAVDPVRPEELPPRKKPKKTLREPLPDGTPASPEP